MGSSEGAEHLVWGGLGLGLRARARPRVRHRLRHRLRVRPNPRELGSEGRRLGSSEGRRL